MTTKFNLYAAVLVDGFNGKLTLFSKVDPGFDEKDIYAGVQGIMLNEIPFGTSWAVPGSLRTMHELPEEAFETDSAVGRVWMMRGHIPLRGLLLSVPPTHSGSLPSVVKGAGRVHEALEEYVGLPDLVAGWITDQAVMLKDGTMRSTHYFQYGRNGLMLRSALPREHAESEDGLQVRYAQGERYIPLSKAQLELVDVVVPQASVAEAILIARAIADPANMPPWASEQFSRVRVRLANAAGNESAAPVVCSVFAQAELKRVLEVQHVAIRDQPQQPSRPKRAFR